jgi:hypothetical protein
MDISQFPYGQVASWLTEGTVVPFLGAGASIAGVGTAPALGAAMLGDLVFRAFGWSGTAGFNVVGAYALVGGAILLAVALDEI